jgi:hypothetical protein
VCDEEGVEGRVIYGEISWLLREKIGDVELSMKIEKDDKEGGEMSCICMEKRTYWWEGGDADSDDGDDDDDDDDNVIEARNIITTNNILL